MTGSEKTQTENLNHSKGGYSRSAWSIDNPFPIFVFYCKYFSHHIFAAVVIAASLSFLIPMLFLSVLVILPNQFDKTLFWGLFEPSKDGLILLATFFIAIATVVSVVNTLTLMYRQSAVLASHDEFLRKINSELSSIKIDGVTKVSDKVHMFSPSLAIGNISGREDLFRAYMSYMCNDSFAFVLDDVQMISQANFSDWHKSYIVNRFDPAINLIAALEKFQTKAGRLDTNEVNQATKSHRSLKRWAKETDDIIRRDFRMSWFSDLGNDFGGFHSQNTGDPSGFHELRSYTDDAREEILTLMRDVRQKDWGRICQDRLKTVEESISFLSDVSHRNADLQSLAILDNFKNKESVRLIHNTKMLMAPIVALQIREVAYICWVFPVKGGTKNNMIGHFSQSRTDLNIIENLMEYYLETLEDTYNTNTVSMTVNQFFEFEKSANDDQKYIKSKASTDILRARKSNLSNSTDNLGNS